LRYETNDDNELAKFLVERAVADEVIGNYLYWYVEGSHP
jgi:phosphatidylinositol 3-kinase